MQSGQFPEKHAWKKLVCQAVRGQAEREWQGRVSSHVMFDGFSCIKPGLLKPCELWVLGRNVPNLQHHCVASIQIMCRLYSDYFTKSCKLCKYATININIIEHLVARCKDTADIRCTISQSILNYWVINILNRYSCLNPKHKLSLFLPDFVHCVVMTNCVMYFW